MGRYAYRNWGRHTACAAAALAIGLGLLIAGTVVASQDTSDGGTALPKERRAESADTSRRADRAEDMLALLHEGNRTELEGARLALEKGQAERVKDYARLLILEHQRCESQLTEYVSRMKLDQQSLEDSREHTTDSPIDRLRVRHPQNFDRAFILAMVGEHGKMLDALAGAMRESRDPELRRLLAGQVPVLTRLKKAGQAILSGLPASRAD